MSLLQCIYNCQVCLHCVYFTWKWWYSRQKHTHNNDTTNDYLNRHTVFKSSKWIFFWWWWFGQQTCCVAVNVTSRFKNKIRKLFNHFFHLIEIRNFVNSTQHEIIWKLILVKNHSMGFNLKSIVAFSSEKFFSFLLEDYKIIMKYFISMYSHCGDTRHYFFLLRIKITERPCFFLKRVQHTNLWFLLVKLLNNIVLLLQLNTVYTFN